MSAGAIEAVVDVVTGAAGVVVTGAAGEVVTGAAGEVVGGVPGEVVTGVVGDEGTGGSDDCELTNWPWGVVDEGWVVVWAWVVVPALDDGCTGESALGVVRV
jgi:hypothetical protein